MIEQNQARKRRIPERDATILLVLLVLSSILLVAGLMLPMMTITKLIMFSNSFSVFSAIIELAEKGHLFLFVVVGCFSIIIPILKLLILFSLVLNKYDDSTTINRLLHLMHEYGRWAMLDVMVVAILIVAVKLGAIASVEIHSGLFVFGSSVLLIMYITRRIIYLTFDPQTRQL